MADGDVVLAAVDPGEGNAVLVLRVDAATGELLGSIEFVPRLRAPLRDVTLLDEQAGRFVRTIMADEEVTRAALLAADAERAHHHHLRDALFVEEVSRRGLILNDRPAAQGAQAQLIGVNLYATEAEVFIRSLLAASGATVVNVVVEPQVLGGTRGHRVLGAVEHEGLNRGVLAAPGGFRGYRDSEHRVVACAFFGVQDGDHGHRNGVVALRDGVFSHGLVDAAGDAVVLRVDAATGELLGSIEFVPRLRDPLRDVTLLDEQAGRFVRTIMADEEVARAALLAADAERAHHHHLRDALFVEEVSRRGLILNDRPAAQGAQAQLIGVNLYATEAEVFIRSLLAASGATVVNVVVEPQVLGGTRGPRVLGAVEHEGLNRGVLAAPEGFRGYRDSEHRVVACAFFGVQDGDHGHRNGLVNAAGDALRVFPAASGDARGPHDDLLVGLDPEVFGRLAASGGTRGHRDSNLDVLVRVFHAAEDGARGPLIAAFEDQGFGCALLAALGTSGAARGNHGPLRVALEADVLGHGLSTAGLEHVFFRGLLTASGSARGRGDGPVASSSTETPFDTMSSVVAPSPPPAPARPSTSSQTHGILVRGTRITRLQVRRLNRKIQQLAGIMNLMQSMGGVKKQVKKRGSTKLMQFKSVLSDFVWFAVPQVLLFYPRKVEDKVQGHKSIRLTWFEIIQSSENPSFEKKFLMTVFVLFISIWVLAILLATFGKGTRCTTLVGALTYISVISIVGFIDYILSKSMPETLYTVVFIIHSVVMVCFITYIWTKYVKEPNWRLPNFQAMLQCLRIWRHPSHHQEEIQENPLRSPLLADDMV